MTQALYRKYRPHQWDDVVGQDHIIRTLRNAVAADRVAHAYLFAGPRGTGKTTSARLLAKAVNCLAPDLASRPCNACEHCLAVNQGRFLDLIEIDAASNTSVDDVRDLRDKINFSPNQGRYKVYIIDEVHMLSTAAFNALLKTLEEPPPHAIFILATTEIHKIPATVLSRCQRHEFRRLPLSDIVRQLEILCDGEGIQYEPEVLPLIARQSAGGMRDAISLLDQLASAGNPITLEQAHTILGTATGQVVLDLVEALIGQDAAGGLGHIHRALDSGADPRQFARQIVDYLRQLLLVQKGNAAQLDVTAETRPILARHAQAFTTPELLRIVKAFNQAATDTRLAWQPALPLEMAFVEALQKPEAPVAAAEAPLSATEASLSATRPRRDTPQAPPPAAQALPGDRDTPASANPSDDPLKSQWPLLLNLVKKRNPNTYGLLNSAKSRHLVNNLLTLGFASDVLRAQMEKDANLDIVQAALEQTLGRRISIRCITIAAKASTPPPDVDSDGMVASAVRDLGGEVVDVQ